MEYAYSYGKVSSLLVLGLFRLRGVILSEPQHVTIVGSPQRTKAIFSPSLTYEYFHQFRRFPLLETIIFKMNSHASEASIFFISSVHTSGITSDGSSVNFINGVATLKV
jgi:hypothetical protein